MQQLSKEVLDAVEKFKAFLKTKEGINYLTRRCIKWPKDFKHDYQKLENWLRSRAHFNHSN